MKKSYPEMEIKSETNSYVDQITLELLMNKSQYHKFVSKNNPDEFNKIQNHYDEIDNYRDDIMELTKELLTSRYKNVSTEVNESFDAYVKSLINHFKMKEIETKNEYNKYDREVDTMFDEVEDQSGPINVDRSVWGKSIVNATNTKIFSKYILNVYNYKRNNINHVEKL